MRSPKIAWCLCKCAEICALDYATDPKAFGAVFGHYWSLSKKKKKQGVDTSFLLDHIHTSIDNNEKFFAHTKQLRVANKMSKCQRACNFFVFVLSNSEIAVIG